MKKRLLKLLIILTLIPIVAVGLFSKKLCWEMLVFYIKFWFPEGISEQELSELKTVTLHTFSIGESVNRISNKRIKYKRGIRLLTNAETARMFNSDTKDFIEELREEGLSDSKILLYIKVELVKVVLGFYLAGIRDYIGGIIKVNIDG